MIGGGGLLLVTVVIGDLIGGALDAVHLGVEVGGVSIMPLLLGFVSMFGVGGLFAGDVFHASTGVATLVGVGTGVVGAGVVFGMFNMLSRSQGSEPFSLRDLVGQTARVAVGIPAGRYGAVQLSYAGQSHELTATADVEVPAGSMVSITAVVGSNVVVQPLAPAPRAGGSP